MKKTLLLCCLLAYFASLAFAQQNAALTWSYLPPIDSFGKAGMVTTDFNSDGKAELIYTSNDSSHTVLRMMQAREGLPGLYFRCNAPLLYTRPHHIGLVSNQLGEAPHLCLAAADGAVYTFSAETLAPVDTLYPEIEVEQFLQVPLGATYRIAALSGGVLYLLNENWQVVDTFDEVEVTDVAVGDVDLDGEPELVTGGEEGFVLNAATLQGEDGLADGFGEQVRIQEAVAGGPVLVIGYSKAESAVRAYEGSNLDLLWEVNQGEAEAHTLAFGDINGDGHQDLAVGNSSQGIRVYDMSNQSTIKYWNTNYDTSFEAAVADFNGDGVATLAIGNHRSSSNRVRQLATYDFENLYAAWQSEEHGENITFGIGDTNGDGYPEKLISGMALSVPDIPTVSILLDGQSGQLLDHNSLGSVIHASDDVAGLEQAGLTYFATAHDDVSLERGNETGLSLLSMLHSVGSEWLAWLPEHPGSSKVNLISCDYDCEIFPFEEEQLIYIQDNEVPRSLFGQIGRQLGFFDGSGRPQLFQYTRDSVLIANLDSLDVAQRFQLSGGPIDPGLSVGDVNADGTLDAVYKTQAGEGVFFDLATGNAQAYPLENWGEVEFEAVQLANTDEDPELEIAVLTEARFLLFDHDFTLLFQSLPLFRAGLASLKALKLISGDFDHNGHMDFLCNTAAGVFQFEASTVYTDLGLPTVQQYTPLRSTYLPPTDTLVQIYFSEDILESSLEGNVEAMAASGESVMFNFEYNSQGQQLLLDPQEEWPADTLYIRLNSQITDLNGNPLDGNFNTLQDGQSDAYLICLPLGSGKDEQGPQLLQGALAADTIPQFQPLTCMGILSDSSEMATSEMAYAEYFLDTDTIVPGDGTPFLPLDGHWDLVAEPFSITLLTNTLDTGLHSLTLLSKDSRGNWGNPETFTFLIRPSDNYQWPSLFNNQLNTSAASQSETQPPLQPRFVIDLPVDFFQTNVLLSNVVIADTLLVLGYYPSFGEPAVLEARSLLNGQVAWSSEEAAPGLPYPLQLGHDRVYYFLDGHLKSKSLRTGESLWEAPSYNNYALFEDRVIHHTEGSAFSMQATNAFNGEAIWSVAVPPNSLPHSTAFPAFYQDTMYSLFRAFKVISPETGAVHYVNTNLERGINAPLVIDTLHHQAFVSYLFSVQAFSLESYSVNWAVESEGLEIFKGNPLYHDGSLFLKTTLGIQSRDPETGELLWAYNWPQYTDTNYPMVANDSTLFVSSDRLTYAFDIDSGELRQRIDAAGALSLSDSLLIIGDLKNGRLIALEMGITEHTQLTASIEILNFPGCAIGFGGKAGVEASGGTGHYTYRWSHSDYQRGPIADGLLGGHYSVTVTDLLMDTVVLEVTIPSIPPINTSFEITHCEEGQANGAIEAQASNGHPPYSYDWAKAWLPDTSYISGLSPGTYSLTVTDQMDCYDFHQVVVDVVSSAAVSVPNKAGNWYPSPATSWIAGQFAESYQEAEVRVWNHLGQICKRARFRSGAQLRLDLSGCPSGVYWVETILDRRRHVQKIVKAMR